ncbi:MAG: pseudouridine synthase [Rubrivivax sp.]|nr:pseudouridine synthase [Rubrivivax sp.]
MELARILVSQGFGTRRECAALCAGGRVSVGGQVHDDPHADLATDDLVLGVDGVEWPFRAKVLLKLHKPVGYECSRAPSHHPSVLDLLPAPLRGRGVQPVGRLDADTSGLLLLSDDGALIHRMTSPRRHVPKVYQVTTRHPVDVAMTARLAGGVVLRDDPAPVRALAVQATGTHSLDLTLAEGKYHQVKRMVAAAGNRVEALHRSSFGGIGLGELAPGQWAWLDPQLDPTLEPAQGGPR